jgi:hypothetical protein
VSTLTARSAPRTIIGLLAALGLVAALTMPALANHDPADGPEVAPYIDATRYDNEGGNVKECLDGALLERFGTAGDGGTASGTVGESDYELEYWVIGKTVTFEVTGALVTEALIKGGPDTNIYDYSGATAGFAGPGIAHDDGLVAPDDAGISNVGFCLIEVPEVESPSLRSPSLRSPSLRSPSLRSPSLRSPSLRSPRPSRSPRPPRASARIPRAATRPRAAGPFPTRRLASSARSRRQS